MEAGNESVTSSADVKSFYDSAPPLQDSSLISQKIEDFINRNSQTSDSGRPVGVVCVTSGGITVPLDHWCVWYIDNFSSGHHGAASTEYFVKAGYAVIFLHRKESLQPYSRWLPGIEGFEVTEDSKLKVCQSHAEVVMKALRDYHAAIEKGLFLELPFTTIFEFLQLLKIVASSMGRLGSRGMFYLATAVSDFCVPWECMAEHKIQSADGPLGMQPTHVPKILSVLRKEWAPLAFCISFKLKTNPDILFWKGDMSLRKYKMQVVIANELVISGRIIVHKINENAEVEEQLVKLLVDSHSKYMEQMASKIDQVP